MQEDVQKPPKQFDFVPTEVPNAVCFFPVGAKQSGGGGLAPAPHSRNLAKKGGGCHTYPPFLIPPPILGVRLGGVRSIPRSVLLEIFSAPIKPWGLTYWGRLPLDGRTEGDAGHKAPQREHGHSLRRWDPETVSIAEGQRPPGQRGRSHRGGGGSAWLSHQASSREGEGGVTYTPESGVPPPRRG